MITLFKLKHNSMTENWNEIHQKYNSLIGQRHLLDSKRNSWNDNKGKITALFHDYTQVLTADGYKAKVVEDDSITNLDSISLVFEDSESGLVNTVDKTPFIKKGASLVFTMRQDGLVGVYITHPYIDGISTQPENKLLAKEIEPRDINIPLVDKYILEFINYLIEFEK